jgi:hypothetical protein
MSRVGHRVEERLIRHLADVRGKPGNDHLRFKVEWYRKAERTFSNPSDFSDNILYVEVWLNEEAPAPKPSQAKTGYWPNCVIS